ncbi:MAG TPA: GNAT family acetyltransferase [Sphingomonas sp.]|nr:GNAT family acetyltransferase [Sphingomonas sp.]
MQGVAHAVRLAWARALANGLAVAYRRRDVEHRVVTGATIAIRACVASDLDGVDALWRASFPNDPPRNRAAVAVPAKLAAQPDFALVAVDGERIVGTAFGGYDGTRGWLYAVAVARDRRGRGIGATLVRAVEARLAAAGCRKINLQIRDTNLAVAAFYAALGYAVEPVTSMGKLLPADGTIDPPICGPISGRDTSTPSP